MMKFLKRLLILTIMPFYITFGLPLCALVGIYCFIRSVPKTWQALAARLIGPNRVIQGLQKQGEPKKPENEHAELLQEMLRKEAKEVLAKIIRDAVEKARANKEKVDWNKVSTMMNKEGNS